MESILPSKPVLNLPSGVTIDEGSTLVDHEKPSHGNKHRSNKGNDESNEDDEGEEDGEDDDDQYVDDDDDDDDDDDQPHVQACHTH